MSLSSTTLSVLQKVGAAAIAADAKLKAEVKDYAQRVHDAILANPDGLKNDALFANWKIVSRLSQALSTIEEEYRKLFATASSLSADLPAPVAKASQLGATAKRVGKKVGKSPQKIKPSAELALASPKTKTAKRVGKKVASKVTAKVKAAPKAKPKAAAKTATKAPTKAATKVATPPLKRAAKAPEKVKAIASPKAKVKAIAKTKAKAPAVPKKVSAKSTGPVALGANPAKVLNHLETLLNANDFTVVSQTAVSKATGIPLGSMTAATKKLMQTGHLLAGPSGSFKLLAAPVAPTL
jgi:hypothetical protein